MTQVIDANGTYGAEALAFDDERVRVGRRFLAALTRQEFRELLEVLGPTMRMRALLPGGPREWHGSAEVAGQFAGWFGEVEDFEVLAADLDTTADRLTLRWRFGLRWPGEAFRRVIEQQGYAKVEDGRVVVLDTVCSGFRPV